MKKKLVALTAALMTVVFLTGCVTSTAVSFNTDISGAEVYVDGQLIGSTPASAKLSNAVWSDPDIVLKKDGYKTQHVDLAKEVKPVNLVCGLLLFWPSLLWCYGPKDYQNYLMVPDTAAPAQAE